MIVFQLVFTSLKVIGKKYKVHKNLLYIAHIYIAPLYHPLLASVHDLFTGGGGRSAIAGICS